MENVINTIIETERLFLVPITMQYAQEIFKEFTPEITTYMFPKSADDISETEKFIKDAIQKMKQWEELQIVILDKITKEFLWCWGIHEINTKTPEPGIRIKKWAFGKKIWREAVAWLADWAQKNLDVDYLFYPVDKDNIPSRKIAESLWGIVQKDEHGNEIVTTKETMEVGRKIHCVEYRITER